MTRRRLGWSALAALAAVGFLYVVLPQIAGLDETWGRLAQGDPWWLAAAALLEVGSYGAYVVLFRGVFAHGEPPIGWRDSLDITLAGVAATRLFATAGVGGIALTSWALSHLGMATQAIVRGLTTFYLALYAVYMAALVFVGLGLQSELLPGGGPFAMTVPPAILGGVVIVTALSTALLPDDLGARVRPHGTWLGRRVLDAGTRVADGAATVAEGVRGALELLRRGNPALLGALGWWALDIGVLWACFHAFGEPPPIAIVVMAYFVGMLANLLPLPGGIGGVEGGMIGAFIAFGVPGGLAVVAVLSYRAFAFWLPTVPGVLAYLRLRHTVHGWDGTPSNSTS